MRQVWNAAATNGGDNRTMDTPEEPKSAHVLVVDDDLGFREQVTAYLSDRGLIAEGADGGAEMDRMLLRDSFDIVVLDLMMPGEDGLSICKRLAKQRGPSVVMLSAMGEEADRIVGLELGADDYLAKPCNPRELLARLRAVMRRRREGAAETSSHTSYAFAGAQLDVSRRRLRGPNGVAICLTGGELSLLMAFVTSPNRILSREALLEHAHGSDADIFDRAVDVQISRLRRKLNACVDRELITTYRWARR
jgi:two-component system OmpR family response regulator